MLHLLLLIAAVSLISVATLLFCLRRYAPYAKSASGLLITFGIAFTFLGIALGLRDFNASNASNSLPALIEGIKLAFWGSLAGVVGSIIVKVRWMFFDTNDQENLDDLAREKQFFANQAEFTAGMQQLNDAFKTFATNQAEQNTRIFMEALRGAIAEFNRNLTNQLGENFKYFNQGIVNLITWQEGYKHHLEKQNMLYTDCLERLEQTHALFADFVSRADHFAQTASVLDQQLITLEQRQALIDQQMDTFYSSLGQRVLDVEGIRAKLEHSLELLHQGSQQQLSAIQTLHQQSNQAFLDTQQQVNDQWLVTQHAQEQAMTEALNAFSRQLVSLSSQFVTDYQPLTQKLKQVVEMSRELT
ncbi:MAG: hypothetical protein VXW65_06320 [Pseudomonadota bacterium]|nr:hypothetical protein [Pseudomonadota bacterium]